LSVPANNPLWIGLAQLVRAFDSLSWAIVQGQPQTEQGHALADYYDEAVTEMTGWIEAARSALACDDQTTDAPEFAARRAGLILCQQNFNQVSSRFYCDLVSFERLSELDELARRKGQQWADWVRGVKDALGQCHQPLYELSQTLLQEWGALTGQGSSSAITTTNPVAEQKPKIRLVRE
jgi:hypothetical protein